MLKLLQIQVHKEVHPYSSCYSHQARSHGGDCCLRVYTANVCHVNRFAKDQRSINHDRTITQLLLGRRRRWLEYFCRPVAATIVTV